MAPPDDPEWTVEDWAKKLGQQARDSRAYRHRLYDQVGLRDAARVLDVGCGTGAVTADIAAHTRGHVVGVDVDEARLRVAVGAFGKVANLEFRMGDAQHLPFADGEFDLVVTNIVLVYVPDKQGAVAEMARVTRPGGHVLATYEPDYASKIDYPEDEPMTPLMLRSLQGIGADLRTGRRLRMLFSAAGLRTRVGMDATDGFLLPQDDEASLRRFEEELWFVEKMLRGEGWTEERLGEWRERTRRLIREGSYLSMVPGFYAIGEKV